MKLVYRIPRFACVVFFTTYLRWRVLGRERVPAVGPVILASNHASFLDPPLVGAAVRRHVNFLARDTLFPIPLLGRCLRAWEVVPVDRDGGGAAGLKGILDRLRKGGAILLFPEGTRSPDGRLQAARSGIGLVAAKSTASVVPVRVFGSHEAMGRGVSWPRPRRVVVKFGPAMQFERLRAEAQTCPKPRLKEIYQEIADDIMAVIASLEPVKD